MEIFETLLSPVLTFLLSIAVLYKWVLKAVYSFQWSQLGALASRFVFCVAYGILITYAPHGETLRLAVRFGINLLFIDEIINWGASSMKNGGINLMFHLKKFIREFKLIDG